MERVQNTNMVDIAEQRYAKELKKATYYVDEIKEKLGTGAKEDLQLAYEKVCELNRTIETAADGVKDAMLEDKKTFEQVRAWSEARKNDLIPIHELRSSLKQELVELEKQETNKREEDWFKKKVELEMMLEEKRAEHEMSKPQAVKLQKYTITPFKGDCKDWVKFWNQFVVEVDSSKICVSTQTEIPYLTHTLLPMKSRNQWQIKEVTRGGEINCLCQVPLHGSFDNNKCPLVSTVVHIVIAVQSVQKFWM